MEYYKEANRFLQKYGSDAFKIIAAYEVAADISRTERYADWYGDYGIFEPSLNEDMTYDKLLSRYKVGLKYLGIIHEQTKAVCGNFLSEQLAEHSENPEFNELMDAFCSPDGLQAVGKVLDEKIKSTPDDESEKGKDQ